MSSFRIIVAGPSNIPDQGSQTPAPAAKPEVKPEEDFKSRIRNRESSSEEQYKKDVDLINKDLESIPRDQWMQVLDQKIESWKRMIERVQESVNFHALNLYRERKSVEGTTKIGLTEFFEMNVQKAEDVLNESELGLDNVIEQRNVFIIEELMKFLGIKL